MMKERLIIKNFGPIKEADLTFGRFNVLIGEQATGKSTVAKLLAICRDFRYIQNSVLPVYRPFDNGIEAWGLKEAVQEDCFIYYECGDYRLTANYITWTEKYNAGGGNEDIVEVTESAFNSELKQNSKRFEELMNELQKIQPSSTGKGWGLIGWRIPVSFLQNDAANIVNQPFSIPAERGLQSIFSLGKSSIQNISDSLFNQLAELDQVARQFKFDTPIEPLNIIYKNDNGHGFVRKKNEEKFYSLYNAASGYQSTIPVVLVTKYYTEIRKKPKTFIIEEPELNLFPTAQNELIKFLVDKTMNYDNTMLIETHSPYVLSSLNNLMNAFQSGQKDAEATAAIIPKKQWLNPGDVSAYVLKFNGTCEDIMDYEEGMIKSEKIDEVSGILNRSFDELLNIQFGIKNEES